MTYSVSIYDKGGKVVSKVDLNDKIYNDENINTSLIHEYYLLQMANGRTAIADAKTRAQVHGSGKKLYRQKGTGNGRAGDKNSPLRRHGGVAFGPTSLRNFSKTMNRKSKKLALAGLLTLKAKEDYLCGLSLSEMAPKTKEALSILANLQLSGKKILLVLNEKDENIIKSFRNIEKVKYLLVDYLNPYDIMNADKIVFLQPALEKINQD